MNDKRTHEEGKTSKYQNLYEIPARQLLHQLQTKSIKDVPKDFLEENIANYGFDYVWLMGVWQTGPLGKELDKKNIEKYKGVLPDFEEEDIIGSPYAIQKYRVSEQIGGEKGLEIFRNRLLETTSAYSRKPLRLVLDFVPNHTAIDCAWVKKHPNFYISTKEKTHFSSEYKTNNDEYFAFGSHGVEVYRDTLQLNYWNEHVRIKMYKTIAKIAEKCDGIRCNMSSLCLNDVFDRNFGGYLRAKGFQKPPFEFWASIIRSIKMKHPSFIFIGETNSHHWELLAAGFDFVYNKQFYDQLAFASASSLRSYLTSLPFRLLFQSCLYIENHDEKRAISIFGEAKEKAAAIITYTLPCLRLHHLGQHQSVSSFLNIQLRRHKREVANEEMERFYFKLQGIVSQRVFQEGEWEYLPAEGSDSAYRLLAWRWQLQSQKRLVVVNYCEEWSSGKVILSNANSEDPWNQSICVTDLLTGSTYLRDLSALRNDGIHVILPPWTSHIFSYS